MSMFTCQIAAQVQRSISDQERPRADSEQMMSALGLDPDLYKVIMMTMMMVMATNCYWYIKFNFFSEKDNSYSYHLTKWNVKKLWCDVMMMIFLIKKDVHDYASNDDSQGDPGREERLPDNHLGRVHFNLRWVFSIQYIFLNFFHFWFIFIIIMLRYDNVCETLAVRILNIKNIPKNNKEVGNVCLV